MEKKRPTYDLAQIKQIFSSAERLAITVRAARDAATLGFDLSAVAGVIAGIKPKMFYKSMTTYADHRVWQDVYHVPVQNLVLYVKFQADLITEFSVVSFKEK